MLVDILHILSSSLEKPVIAVLIVLVVTMVVIIGMVVAEVFTERRYFKLSLPNLIDDLQRTTDIENVVRDSGMLGRQKTALLELLRHEDATENELESLAVDLTFQERAHFDARIKVTDTIAKIAPMFGLMGTLIPLGPGIVAIGGGDTATLSSSLQIAFDTTVLGLIVGAMALLVSAIRKSWYAKYMSTFEAAAECVLEKACERVRARANTSGTAAPRLATEASAEGSVAAPADGAVAASAQIPGQMEPSAGGSSTFAQREAFPLEGAQR